MHFPRLPLALARVEERHEVWPGSWRTPAGSGTLPEPVMLKITAPMSLASARDEPDIALAACQIGFLLILPDGDGTAVLSCSW